MFHYSIIEKNYRILKSKITSLAGIYLHIPFCKKACVYCDFHFSTSLQSKGDLLLALNNELRIRKNYLGGESIDTIYFGGGTPSLLSADELAQLLDTIFHLHLVKGNAEITLEANPDDLDNSYLHSIRNIGINRLSIGLQSFIDEELKWMNRVHTAAESEYCVKLAQDAGFDNISIDLIYGSRFQNEKNWESNLQKAFALKVQHLSAYNLTVEEKTLLGSQVKKGKEKDINEEKSAVYFQALMAQAAQNDFIHYEISNFCKEGYHSRHNSSYWLGKKYLGIGPSAHSYDHHSRQWNVKNNPVYIRSFNKGELNFEKEILSPEQHCNEYLLTSLRTIWGADLNYIQTHFGENVLKLILKEAKPYLESGDIIEKENKLILSNKGKLIADRIASDLFI